jgi:rubrerythrin
MQQIAEQWLTIGEARLSRRRVVGGAVAGGGALALVAAVPGLSRAQDATPAASPAAGFGSDVDVLNYALTLEHLEYAFYRDGVDLFDFGTDGFGFAINDQLAAIRDHEAVHVQTLTAVIGQLGGTPVAEGTYKFDDAYASDSAFLKTAMALENTGVQAYDGAGQFLRDPALLTAAGTIVAVEARHASYLNLINDKAPFPAAFEKPLTMAQVLKIAGPFLAS